MAIQNNSFYKTNSLSLNRIICDPNKCTGCSSCSFSCPKKAITMEKDIFGFLRPVVDLKICIDCGVCNQICPANNSLSLETKYIKKCYAATCKDEYKSPLSTSGGLATIISKRIIDNGGVVYAVTFNQTVQSFCYERIATNDRLSLASGSKYTQAYLGNSFEMIKSDLNNGVVVLFIGSPCYVAGLKSFLKKDNEKLILIDLICHGTPSQQMLFDSVPKRIKNSGISNISFRDGKEYVVKIFSNSKKMIYKGDAYSNAYVEAFSRNLSLRESCFYCKYASQSRVGDLTLGDFWGISKNSFFYKKREKGLSLCLVNNEKGHRVFQAIKEFILFEERPVEEAIFGNSQLRHPTLINTQTLKFVQNYQSFNFIKSIKRTRNFKQKINRFWLLRRIIKH